MDDSRSRSELDGYDLASVVSGVGRMVHLVMKEEGEVASIYDIYDERRFPIEGRFYGGAFSMKLNAVVPLYAAALVDRLLLALPPLHLTPYNWRRILLVSTLVAEKFTEERAVWNEDYRHSFPLLDLHDLRSLEAHFLSHLKYNLIVSCNIGKKGPTHCRRRGLVKGPTVEGEWT